MIRPLEMLSHSRRQRQADNLTRGKEAETKQKKEGHEGADTTAIKMWKEKQLQLKRRKKDLKT